MFAAAPNNTLEYMDKGCYDPVHKQVRFIGHAHYGDQRYHQYDEATNTFSNLGDPPWDNGGGGQPSYIGHGYQHNAMDPTTGDHYYRRYGSNVVWHLTRATGAWRQIAAAPNTEITGSLEWLPTIGAQGGLILYLGTSCHRWDKATNTWSTPNSGTFTSQTYHTVGVLSVPNNVVVFGGGNAGRRMWKIGATGSATAVPDCPIAVGINNSVTTACPVNGDVIVIGSNSSAAKFNVNSNSWSAMNINGAPNFGAVGPGSKITAVPIRPHGVIMFIFGDVPAIWLYKHS